MCNSHWAIAHRNTLAVFSAMGLVGILVWALMQKNHLDSQTLLKTEQVNATITKIEIIKYDASGRYNQKTFTNYVVSLKLPDSKKIKFILARKPPQEGTQVPILLDHYTNGKIFYYYNLIDWYL